MLKVYSLIFFFALFGIMRVSAQVAPAINSGNPTYPFPQFQPYSHPDGTKLGNLADHNPEGVPHAELEQRTRDAWRVMCNNIVEVPNIRVGGVQYLASNAPLDCKCAEGYGYYLLGAAFMADKKVYDGLYMYYHDNSFNGVKRFIDGQDNRYGGYNRGLSYAGSFGAGGASFNPYGGAISGNSATDGDHDIAMALLVAYKQWGERSGIILPNGQELNYKEEALSYITAMADTGVYAPSLPMRKFYSGVIGLDGYTKNGDSWNELTDFAAAGYQGMARLSTGNQTSFFDYHAPAYYKQFADWLTAIGGNPWLIAQYRRGEASSDWLMGQLYAQKPTNLPFVGQVSMASGAPVFSTVQGSEDVRAPWRTLLNYTWHGNPNYSWDLVTHQVRQGVPNTYLKDMSMRLGAFLKNPSGAPWNNECVQFGDVGLTFKGPGTISVPDINGKAQFTNKFVLNWAQGTSSPGAVASQDFDLMGQMFRQCVIEWDADTPGYLESKPKYFHEWLRLLGMLVLTGNHHAPSNMVPTANLKVYHKVDKTMAFSSDVLTFTVDYRNYGSLDATGSKVTLSIPNGLTYTGSSRAAVVAGQQITWDLGVVPGFKTGALEATKGQFTVSFKLSPQASGSYCISPTIYCNNGTGWVSNEYPNNQTSVMERNCVDVVKRALKITKTANRHVFNPGDTLSYSIDFTNSSDAGWINGGRPGVNFSFAHDPMPSAIATTNVFKFRIFNDASEAYIDYGNYRFSYFINETSINCFANEAGCNTGWSLMRTIYEGGNGESVQFFRESIEPGADRRGAWNQRVVIKFAPQLATTAQHLLNYAGLPNRVKEGGTSLMRGVWRLSTSNYSNISWRDDWSWDSTAAQTDGGIYFPVTPDFTNPSSGGVPVTSWHRNACQTASKTIDNVLVEEWDGYVWRRIFGNGPLPGRDIENVLVTDTLPVGLTFAGFVGRNPFGIAPTYNAASRVISWSIPKLLISQQGKIMYRAKVNIPSGGNCPTKDEIIVNTAWIQGASESPAPDRDTISVSCTKVVVCNSTPSFLITPDKAQYGSTDTQVTYGITYKQTNGTIGKSGLSSLSDWTLQSGSGVSIAGGTLTTASNSNFVVTHNYSHGTNTLENGIEATLALAQYAKLGIVLRYDPIAKTGVYVVMRPEYNGTIFQVFNNTQLLASGNIPVMKTTMDLQIKLNGGRMDVWLGTAPFDGPAMYTLNGLLVQPGYAGVVHGTVANDNSGTHRVTYWNAHLDSGFNLELRDKIPTGVTSPSQISDNGATANNEITWVLSAPNIPVLYNTAFTRSWTGTISDCSNGLQNNAYVNLSGQPRDLIQTCNFIKCVSNQPGDSIVLKVANNSRTFSADLTWTTSSAEDARQFEVLRSQGGSTYTLIGTVPATATYTFVDPKPYQGISYYQVRQVNTDGTSVISSIVTFGFNGDLSVRLDNINRTAQMTWVSAYELNTVTYQVSRSGDGITWETIYTTAAKGTNVVYTSTDMVPLAGVSYYRVRQIFADGTSIYSVVLSFGEVNGVTDAGGFRSQFKIYPNPIVSELNILWNADSPLSYSAQLFSPLGVAIASAVEMHAGHLQHLDVPASLPAGSYILKVTCDRSVLHFPLVKK